MIRHATVKDVPRLVEMGLRFRRASVYAHMLTENADQMAAFATGLVTSEAGVVLLAEQDGQIVGMLGLLCAPHFLSGDLNVGEVFWWVEPEARTVGVRLLAAGEAWAVSRGADIVQMVAPNARVERFYAKRGYQPLERAFFRRLHA